MDAVQALTGSGGWPMSVFLTPDGRPFYGGTYFPDTPRHGMPSFRQVLASIAGVWRDDRARAEALAEGFDPVHGGFGGAPKFPAPMTIEHLLRRSVRSGDAQALAMAQRTIDAMAAGGIYDQLGGGFARY